MTVRCIEFTGDRAVVIIEPNWLGRLLGARTLALDLVRARSQLSHDEWLWRATATGRRVTESAILDALEWREIGEKCRVTSGGTVAV